MPAKKVEPKEEIKVPEEVAVERKPAPTVTVVRRDRDDRMRLQKEYDEKNPDWTHSWDYSDVSQEKLARSAMEVVKEGGYPVRHGGDILLRQPKELFKEKIKAEQEDAMQTVRRVVKEKDLPKYAQARRPVTPTKAEMED